MNMQTPTERPRLVGESKAGPTVRITRITNTVTIVLKWLAVIIVNQCFIRNTVSSLIIIIITFI